MTTIKVTKREAAEFAAMVRGDHPDQKAYRRYVLAELRLARQRALMLVNEIEAIGTALKGNFVGPDMAIEWLADAKALMFLQPTQPEVKDGAEDDNGDRPGNGA